MSLLTEKDLNTPKIALTEKEFKFMDIMFNNCGNGADTLEYLIEDNYSWQALEDMQDLTGFSKHQIAGLVGSLEKKWCIDIEYRDHDCDLIFISGYYLDELKEQNPELKF